MEIALATNEDILNIMNLIKLCIKDLENQGIYQWNDYYPTLGHIKESIQNKSLHILKNKDPLNTQSAFGAYEIYDFVVQEIENFLQRRKSKIFERAME